MPRDLKMYSCEEWCVSRPPLKNVLKKLCFSHLLKLACTVPSKQQTCKDVYQLFVFNQS